MALYTLAFPDRATAEGAAKQLGFWNDEDDCLNISGQSKDEHGNVYGWYIDDIGHVVTTPAVMSSQYYVNITGSLPAPALAYEVPYGSAGGRKFASDD